MDITLLMSTLVNAVQKAAALMPDDPLRALDQVEQGRKAMQELHLMIWKATLPPRTCHRTDYTPPRLTS